MQDDVAKLPLSGKLGKGKFAIVDSDVFDTVSHYKWGLLPAGYVRRVSGKRTIYLHREILTPPVRMQIDHINRNKLDNRRANLRTVTAAQNCQNRLRTPSHRSYIGTSAYIGVQRSYTRKPKYGLYIHQSWQAHIKGHYLGSFKSELDAARAYDAAARKDYGEFAVLNLP